MNEDEEATLELMQSPVTSVTVVFTHFEITMFTYTSINSSHVNFPVIIIALIKYRFYEVLSYVLNDQ